MKTTISAVLILVWANWAHAGQWYTPAIEEAEIKRVQKEPPYLAYVAPPFARSFSMQPEVLMCRDGVCTTVPTAVTVIEQPSIPVETSAPVQSVVVSRTVLMSSRATRFQGFAQRRPVAAGIVQRAGRVLQLPRRLLARLFGRS